MKKLILILLAMLTILGVVGCQENNSTTTGTNTDGTNPGYLTTITYWNIFTGPDGEEMAAMVEDFNAEYDGVYRVLTQTIPANDFYDKMNTSVPMGQGPDVAIMHLDRVSRYAKQGLLNSFEDLGMTLSLTEDDYIPAVWQAGVYEGERYGIPLDVHPIGLYYNKDILDASGVEVPTTWDELIDVCDVINDPDNEQYCFPMSNVWPSQFIFQAALYQNGGDDLDDDGLYPAFNNDAGFTAMKRLHDLVYTYEMSPENVTVDEDLALFRQGKAAFHINGIWMLNGIIDSGINFGTAPIETLFGDTPATSANSHNFVMPYKAEVSDDKKAAILAFIEYISANSLRWANAGQIPANLNVLQSQEYLALPYHSTFVNVETIRFADTSPYFSDSFEPVYSRVTEAMNTATANIQALLDDAEQEGRQRVDEALAYE